MQGTPSPAIVYIVPYLEAAGTERHLLHLVQALHRDHRIGLLAPPGPLLPEFERLGVEHRSFPRLETGFREGIAAFRRLNGPLTDLDTVA